MKTRTVSIFALVFLLFALFCVTAGCDSGNQDRGRTARSWRRSAVGAQHQPDKPALPSPLSSNKRARHSEEAARTTQIVTEQIPGYMIPSEYLIIPSRHYPGAVTAVSLPVDYGKSGKKRYPLVIAFGGMGECMRRPRQGALAWLHYYKADEAVRALETGRLESPDFRGLVTPVQLRKFNETLKKYPYRGIILACPSSPVLTMGKGPEFPDYEAFVMQELIPELTRRYRVAPGKVGVDGVSMGGARSMYYGFKYPKVFSSIGSLQGAFGPSMNVYRTLLKKNGKILKGKPIQLVTSDKDHMAPSVERMHNLLAAEGIPHLNVKLTGPHDYIFNQGPGSIALLMFHNQALGHRASGPVK